MPGQADRFLILGGTAEAAKLAEDLTQKGGAEIITSLAGRTIAPVSLPGLVRIGGFGGVDGLVRFLATERITHVFDATHPFAMKISANATSACAQTGIPLTILARAAWERHPDDLWIEVDTLEAAAEALPHGAVVFLALGRQHIDVFAGRHDCRFVLRMIDAPADPLAFTNSTIILGKAQGDWEAEKQLLKTHAITHIVARNSGGKASYGKIIAARSLRRPVIMIGRGQYNA
ncbi:cobalt-precorrin-6A reductase [Rhizobium sp.]|uniref:cobalt-precorrin-6A reductase n=1 Tax=Rhizobium sp. TaxID=391 RepID=UPI000E8A73CA|nr:cobalt-precorrin-6A reductase [Rhizobium sp.]